MPRSLRPDEHVTHRLERRLVDERPVRNAEVPVARSPIEKRQALAASHRNARQFEQWQLYAATNSSDTSYATALHAQRPLSTTSL